MPETKKIHPDMLKNEQELNDALDHKPPTQLILERNHIVANFIYEDIDFLLNILPAPEDRSDQRSIEEATTGLISAIIEHNNKLLLSINQNLSSKLADSKWLCLQNHANEIFQAASSMPIESCKMPHTTTTQSNLLEKFIHKLESRSYIIYVITQFDTSPNKYSNLSIYLNQYLNIFKQTFRLLCNSKLFSQQQQEQQVSKLIVDFYYNVIIYFNYNGLYNIIAMDKDLKNIIFNHKAVCSTISMFFMLYGDLKTALIFLKDCTSLEILNTLHLVSLKMEVDKTYEKLQTQFQQAHTIEEINEPVSNTDMLQQEETLQINSEEEAQPVLLEDTDMPQQEVLELEEDTIAHEILNSQEGQKELHRYYTALRKNQTLDAQLKASSLSPEDTSWIIKESRPPILFNDAIYLGKNPLNNKEYFGVIDLNKKTLISNDQASYHTALKAGFVYSKCKQSGVKVLKCDNKTGEIKAEIKVNSSDMRIVNGCGYAYPNRAGNLLLFFDQSLNHQQITAYCNKSIYKKPA